MIKGLDVSRYQGNIDWKKVAKAGFKFAIIRAGFGKRQGDVSFDYNIREALKNGIEVGVYWFIYAKDAEDIKGNIRMCDAIIRSYKDRITMGVWCDWEYDSDKYINRKMSVKERTEFVKSFINGINNKGYECGLYANPDYLKNMFGNMEEYPLWLAYYTKDESKALEYKPDIWQYNSEGVVDGIKGKVDLDYYMKGNPKSTKEGIVATNGSNLMLREGKSTKHKILARIPNNEKIEIIEKEKGNWWRISYNNIVGYASKKYIKEV